ncbi:hypothetical protein [Tunturibacter empetritectus]|uniref:Uncharacterized protein n=1 Tax=Tunturiibacter lichenicola TaxID=2051959 RepID=A0A7W8N574_9BACT|nr:hypothetical protein [Edaphobacter lichenicola]MBB5343685.1 hypothetical protein [Edaphobacter lichenicola]
MEAGIKDLSGFSISAPTLRKIATAGHSALALGESSEFIRGKRRVNFGVGSRIFLGGGVCGVLLGFLRKMGVLIVVFWWCKRGGLVVKHGVLAVSFLASKDAP